MNIFKYPTGTKVKFKTKDDIIAEGIITDYSNSYDNDSELDEIDIKIIGNNPWLPYREVTFTEDDLVDIEKIN